MYEEFTQNRIAQLRTQKEVSARDMSLSLGQNNSYINQIENHYHRYKGCSISANTLASRPSSFLMKEIPIQPSLRNW